jgi:hypothetical protein
VGDSLESNGGLQAVGAGSSGDDLHPAPEINVFEARNSALVQGSSHVDVSGNADLHGPIGNEVPGFVAGGGGGGGDRRATTRVVAVGTEAEKTVGRDDGTGGGDADDGDGTVSGGGDGSGDGTVAGSSGDSGATDNDGPNSADPISGETLGDHEIGEAILNVADDEQLTDAVSVQAVEQLLTRRGGAAVVNFGGGAALVSAACQDKFETAQLLEDHGATWPDDNATTDGRVGEALFMIADDSALSDTEATAKAKRLLVRNGSSTVLNWRKGVAATTAAASGKRQMSTLLLARGAKPAVSSSHGLTAPVTEADSDGDGGGGSSSSESDSAGLDSGSESDDLLDEED